jgi:hypothetical protein
VKVHSKNDSNLILKNRIKQNFEQFFNKNFSEINSSHEKSEEKYIKINQSLKKYEILLDAKEKAKKNFAKKLPLDNYANNPFEKTVNFDDVRNKFIDYITLIKI